MRHYPKLNHWLSNYLVPKPVRDVVDSPAGKKMPEVIERNFARHNWSLFCNNESWGAKFSESVVLKNTIPLIPELVNVTLGFGSFDRLDPTPCLSLQVEGKLKRIAVYEEAAHIAETCLDIIIRTVDQ